MFSYFIFILAVVLALFLWQRAKSGTVVPLSVWLIPLTGLTAVGAIAIGLGLDEVLAAARAAAPPERPQTFAEGLADVLATSRFFFLGAAALAALETALAGRAGDLQSDPTPVLRNPMFALGSGLAAAVGGLIYWRHDFGLVEHPPMAEVIFVIPPLIVAGAALGIARTLRRKTPSSFPFAVAGTGGAGLLAFYLGGIFTRWEADCLAFIAEPSNTVLVGPASPNVPFASAVQIATLAAGAALLVLASFGALLGEKPWKWGTLGDGILFLLVTILLASSLGWSWDRMSLNYEVLDQLSRGETDTVVDGGRPVGPPTDVS